MAKTPGIAATALFAWALWAGQPAMGQDPVDGVCDESVRNGCSAGTPNAAAYPDEPVVYQWRCDGMNGGRNSGRCALWFSVVGVCDESARNGCAAGNPNDDAFPDSPTMYAWRCDGMNAGANSGRCHIRVADVVDGACDDTVRNGCSAGTPNDDAIPDNATTYLWRCDGQRGGTNSDKCHIRVADVVDGVCDDGVRNGCSAGTANDAAIPDNATAYLWRCDGQRGGRNSDKCHIRVADVVDGACDDTVRNGCSAGTVNDDAIPDNASTYLWRCDGLRGGRNSDKCHIRVADVVDGVCDDTVRNGCSAGAANDDAFADNSTGYLWRCDGLRGGRNSDKCFIRVADVPVDGVCDDTVRNGCSAGTANDDAFADNSTGYLWRCDGLHGGRNSDKCFIRVQDVPVDGVCDDSVRDGCSAGTANDIAVADTTSHYRWRCDGEHGGANSGTCTRAKPPVAQVSCGGSWSPSPSTACSGESLSQTRTCNAGCNDGDCATSRTVSGTVAPRNCQWGSWSQWGDWGACSVACGGGTQSRDRTRSKTVRETCGGACPESATDTQEQSCNTHPCRVVVVCGNDPWTPDRSTVCRGESFNQTRTCNAGCNTGDCSTSRSASGTSPPRSCQWGSWSRWDDCSAACGGGTQRRSRSKTVPEACGGACPGSPTETQSCNTHDCPVECGDDPWTPDRSTVCRGESFNQTRTCNTGCNTGDCSESRSASGTSPPRVCQWGSWSRWDDCSAACGGGTQRRSRSKTVPEACGGACPGSPTETQSCNTHDCPVECGDDPWTPDRSTVCRGESFNQTRTCNTGCNTGDCSESRSASGTSPPRVCQWGSWSRWDDCSAACGGGTQRRSRSKTVPEACGGGCPGSPTETQSCNTHDCPVECGDDPWTPGTGTVCSGQSFTQTRTCNTGCNTGDCSTSRTKTGTTRAVNGIWRTGSWGAWGQCIDCQQARSRTVTCNPPSCGGAACPAASKPAVTETQPCVGSNPIPGNLCRN